MKINRALPIIWLPLLAFWTFLVSIHINTTPFALSNIVPTVFYVLVSFLLALQLQLVIGGKKEGFFVKFGTINIIGICLFVSTITILCSVTGEIAQDLSIIILICSLLANSIIAEFLSYSNKQVTGKIDKERKAWADRTKVLDEQQKEASYKGSAERRLSIESRKDWKAYLKKAAVTYAGNQEIIDEITRIQDIVDYSSYFRKELSVSALSEIQSGIDEPQILGILKEIG